ncbi:MAG: class I SAM-dependent methyltransferase [Acidimicrobiales bacterium]
MASEAATAGYVRAVRVVNRGLERVGVVGLLDRNVERRPVHWMRSLLAIHDVEAMAALGVPWWSYQAIGTVDAWLAGRSGATAFEWGSGASTVWLAARTDRVTAVEHHEGFAATVDGLIPAHAEVIAVPPVATTDPAVPSAKPGNAGLDFSAYVAAIDRTDDRYDLICIDGRARGACLDRAVDHLVPDGIIVFDNTDRDRYRAAIDRHPELETTHLKGLTPALPYPSTTTILRRRG